MKLFLLMLNVVVLSSCYQILNYSRSALQKKYSGFGEKWIPMMGEDGSSTIGYFEAPPGENRLFLSPNPEDAVSFTLYNREIPYGLRINSTRDLPTSFSKNKPAKFVTHGWLSSGNTSTCTSIKDGFLKKYDANVFIMDWKDIAGNVFYPIPMHATTDVAAYYAKFLNDLVEFGVDPANMHLVGHSLGAHISGFAARSVKKARVSRVSALDPALPGFDVGLVKGGRLSAKDAEFVDVIHTCAGFLGMGDPLGHVDFYPNGGRPPQPGCENVFQMIEACSHGRSWLYFAESLKTEDPFLAFPCDSFDTFVNEKSCKEKAIPMGDPTPTTARGTYFLETIATPPFVNRDVLNEI